MASPLQTRKIERVQYGERELEMLEWKARILTLAIALGTFWDQLLNGGVLNWNW
jgi:hypothetical protein